MRIQFCGAGGSGKTTLMRATATALGLTELPSPARGIQKGYGILAESDQWAQSPEDRMNMQADIFHAIRDSLFTNDNYVSDRSLLDNFCYAVWKSGQEMDDDTVKAWEEAVTASFVNVDLVVYCGIDAFDPPHGDFRTTKRSERRLMDVAMYGAFTKLRGNFRRSLAILKTSVHGDRLKLVTEAALGYPPDHTTV